MIGPPRIEYDGIPVKLDTRKTLALLIFLAVTRRNHRRDSLLNMLWPDSNQTQGQALLRHSLYAIRKTLEGDWINSDRDNIGINPGADFWVDADRFHSLLAGYGKHGHGEDEVCVSVLKEELDVATENETVQLCKAIKAGFPRTEAHSIRAAAGIHPNNLPRQLTSFIGRTHEINEVKRLLSTTTLLTFTGTGGCGKTRLALRVVSDVLEEYRDGVWLVELASLSDPALVAKSVASTLDVHEHPGQSITETLSDFLRSKQMMIVLDNCEHLNQACGELAESLLHSTQNLKILVTSREPLYVTGECEFLVPPLRVPDSDDGGRQSVEQLMQYEAVRLYQERAGAVITKFAVTNENASAVAGICMHLDGLPLAIELATARLKILSPQALLERMGGGLEVLKGGARDLPARQKTLRKAIGWSYDLLDENEKTLFRRLSVFAGGFSITAVEAVCSIRENELGTDMLDGLASLVDKSLLRILQPYQEANREPRFQMLETIRKYAGEKLAESSESRSLNKRFAAYFTKLAEKA